MWRASGRKYQMKRDRRKETENKMKKVYEKPQVYMERFELAEHIASGCTMQIVWRDASCYGSVGINLTQECVTNGDNEAYCVYQYSNILFTS